MGVAGISSYNSRKRSQIMASLNKVMLIGNLGKDPELRYTASGQAVTGFSLATSEKFKDKTSGEWVDRTEWHKVTLWGKLAELAGEYLSKGKTVYIEGRLQTRKYDKDGVTHYSTEIVGDKMEFLSAKGERSGGDSSASSRTGGNYEEPPILDDDIPF
jgi:single-strand DNA-binding protein